MVASISSHTLANAKRAAGAVAHGPGTRPSDGCVAEAAKRIARGAGRLPTGYLREAEVRVGAPAQSGDAAAGPAVCAAVGQVLFDHGFHRRSPPPRPGEGRL